MPLIDAVQDHIWAIHPAKLDEIKVFIEHKLSGEESFHVDPQAAAGKSGNKANDRYEIQNGVAVIPVFGTLMKRANLFTQYSGGTSYQLLQRDITQALSDKEVRGVVLEIDSPGGSVDGVFELVDFLYSMRGRKPIVAASDGTMASAAYMIASAADKIMLGTSAQAGSIGVLAMHYDLSKADEMSGLKRTIIYAGKYKAMGNDTEPLNAESQGYLQSKVDYLYGLFLSSVSRNRGIDSEKIRSMADGQIFIGAQALEAGLIDSMGTIEQAVGSARGGSIFYIKKGVNHMNTEELKAQFPDVYNQTFQAGADSMKLTMEEAVNKARNEGTQAGCDAERARAMEITESGKDYPEIVLQAIKDGVSAEGSFKLFYNAEKNGREKALKDMQVSLSSSAGQSGKEIEKDNQGASYMSEVDAYQKEHDCSRSQALLAVANSKPELHQAYLEGLKSK